MDLHFPGAFDYRPTASACRPEAREEKGVAAIRTVGLDMVRRAAAHRHPLATSITFGIAPVVTFSKTSTSGRMWHPACSLADFARHTMILQVRAEELVA
ncbi:hypothetical protein [Brevundimonas aurifodinae]|uniref:Uncharacterized protein n=1 Tax=Brevundimonas aurifodinae TaxID=1508312 RepID=A0ABV1NK51_9CAUL